jgi:DNA (cytosine-5)-methyltransferase 1
VFFQMKNTTTKHTAMTHGSLFSGIGGFDLAAAWMGWENVFHCEINPFGQKLLKYHFPKSISYNDITKTDFSVHRGTIDVLSGGFPCQPFSSAGKRLGTEDSRHLWPSMLRAIREIQPTWVVGENVFGIINWSEGLVFEEVQTDLEAEGYEVQPYVLPAAGVGSVHRRDRVWFVAYSQHCADIRNSRKIPNTETPKDTKCDGRIFRDVVEERTKIRSFGNIGSRGEDGIHLSKGVATNSIADGYSDGFEEAGGEVRCSETRGMQQSTGIRGKQNAADPASKRREIWQQNGGWQNETENSTGMDIWSERLCNNGVAADTERVRLEQCEDTRKMGDRQGEMGREGSESTYEPPTTSKIGDVTDTGNERLQRSEFHGTSERREWEFDEPRPSVAKLYQITDWDDFPTESPVCSGNDGISDRLDGITFPKWRNESIKGYGNAVVPQIPYAIFKTIEEYEQRSK